MNDFWIFMLICVLFIPAMMFVLGLIFEKRPPKKINYLCGYRTRRSMKNKEAWSFANSYMGKLFWKVSIPVFFAFFAAMLPLISSDEDTVGNFGTIVILAQAAVMLLCCVFPVERELKRRFDEDGRPKE